MEDLDKLLSPLDKLKATSDLKEIEAGGIKFQITIPDIETAMFCYKDTIVSDGFKDDNSPAFIFYNSFNLFVASVKTINGDECPNYNTFIPDDMNNPDESGKTQFYYILKKKLVGLSESFLVELMIAFGKVYNESRVNEVLDRLMKTTDKNPSQNDFKGDIKKMEQEDEQVMKEYNESFNASHSDETPADPYVRENAPGREVPPEQPSQNVPQPQPQHRPAQNTQPSKQEFSQPQPQYSREDLRVHDVGGFSPSTKPQSPDQIKPLISEGSMESSIEFLTDTPVEPVKAPQSQFPQGTPKIIRK